MSSYDVLLIVWLRRQVMTTAGIQPGGQRWLWKLPDEEVTERWERDRRGWVADKAWEGVDVESVTLTFSMLATEDEVTLTSDPAALPAIASGARSPGPGPVDS